MRIFWKQAWVDFYRRRVRGSRGVERRMLPRRVEEASTVIQERLFQETVDLSAHEEEIQKMMGLEVKPTLVIVDEELGTIIQPRDRRLPPDRRRGNGPTS